MNNELKQLSNHIGHIKDIVAMQNDISGVSTVNEKISLSEVADTAIRMGLNSSASGIKVIKNYRYTPSILADRSKLLQILINLIKNAKEALIKNHKFHKEINITIKKGNKPKCVQIIIEDNGVGIEKENLIKVFSMGYTTKSTGHGFGLHSCALVAHELGGDLLAESEGHDKGATFILTLPVITTKKTRIIKEKNNARK